MIKAIVTFGYVGLLRPAPGTWGSLAAVLCAIPIIDVFGLWGLCVGVALSYAIGLWATRRYITDQTDDPSEVVIDEVAGQWFALVPVAAAWPFLAGPGPVLLALGISLALFRVFDILKPGLVRRADAMHGAHGIMLDDVIAGLFAAIGTFACLALWMWIAMGTTP